MRKPTFKTNANDQVATNLVQSLKSIEAETDAQLVNLGPLAKIAADWRIGKLQKQNAERSARLIHDANFDVGAYKINLAIRDAKDEALDASRAGRLKRSEETVLITGQFADEVGKITVEQAFATSRNETAFAESLQKETEAGAINADSAQYLAELIREVAADSYSVWRTLGRGAIASEFEKADQSFKSDSKR